MVIALSADVRVLERKLFGVSSRKAVSSPFFRIDLMEATERHEWIIRGGRRHRGGWAHSSWPGRERQGSFESPARDGGGRPSRPRRMLSPTGRAFRPAPIRGWASIPRGDGGTRHVLWDRNVAASARAARMWQPVAPCGRSQQPLRRRGHQPPAGSARTHGIPRTVDLDVIVGCDAGALPAGERVRLRR